MHDSNERGEWAVLHAHADLGGLEVLHARYVRHRFSPHVHDGFAIGVIEAGAEEIDYGRNQHCIAGPGSVVVVNPWEIHTGRPGTRDGWTYRMIYPGAALMRSIAGEVFGPGAGVPHFPDLVISDCDLFDVIRETHACLLDPCTSRPERQEALTRGLGLLIERHARNAPPDMPARHNRAAVKRAAGYIDSHFARPVPLDTLADIAGLSRFHLCRAFREVIGISPHAYQIHRRIEFSRKMIRAGEPLAEIAAQAGFVDQSHLGRHFKRIVGVTPGAYASEQAPCRNGVQQGENAA